MVKLIAFIIVVIALFMVFEINPFKGIKGKIEQLKPKPKKKNVKQYLKTASGNSKENIFVKSAKESESALKMIGQEGKFKMIKRLSILLGIATAVISFLIFQLPLLSAVIGLGFTLIPLWATKLSLYKHNEYVNNELETTLSQITVSYQRTRNIVKSVEENVASAKYPLNIVLENFLYTLENVDFNKVKAIEQMKGKIDNILFQEWCDVLILCQDDTSLMAGLNPIIDKLGMIKQEQEANKTLLMLPVSQTRNMVILTVSVIPLLYISNREWYSYLVGTNAGQIAMSVVTIFIFLTIEKTINLIKPIEYKL